MEEHGREDGVIAFNLVDALNGSDPNAASTELKTNFQLKGTSLGGETPNAGGLVVDEDIGVDTLTAQCYVEAVVHGTLTADQFSEPASLFIIQFAFCPRSRSRRFRDVAITLTFTAGTELLIQPENLWKTGTTTIDRQRSHTISPSLEGSVGPAKGTLSYQWQQTDSRKIEDHVWIEGVVKALSERPDGRRVPDSAVWELHENKQTSSGVPSFFQTAVLLKRESTLRNEPFKALLSITGDVHTHPSDWAKIRGLKDGNGAGNSHQAPSGIRKLHKNQPEADPDDKDTVPMAAAQIPLFFDPKLPDRNPLGLDKTRLQAIDLSQFKGLVHVRSWAESLEEAAQTQGQSQAPAQSSAVVQQPVQPVAPQPAATMIPVTRQPAPANTSPAVTLPAVQPVATLLPPVAATAVYTQPQLSGISTVGELDIRLAKLAAELELVDEEARHLQRMIELVAEKRRLVQETHIVHTLRNNALNSKKE
ncbi:hypothetical protein SEUCBS139899_008850 [Sporothrix eucalyptigena]|uniref:Uncharacterized protein n=1 Tax=Sporothrix eucalyptigena TaxID=1812306 RepID=A0ABP0ARY1_9PEZI